MRSGRGRAGTQIAVYHPVRRSTPTMIIMPTNKK